MIENYDGYKLETRYDSRASFYGKAHVVVNEFGTEKKLYSYQTHVATIKIDIDGDNAEIYGDYSQTTNRHIKEFLKQNGFKAESTKQIMKDYLKETK